MAVLQRREVRPSQPPLTSEVIQSPLALSQLRAEWDALLDRALQPAPTQSPTWLLAWWSVFNRGELLTVAIRAAGRLVAIAPLYRAVHWRRPGIPYRRITFLGNGEKEQHEIASDATGIVCEPGYERAVTSLLGDMLTSGALGSWDELVGQRILATESATLTWLRALEARGLRHQVTSTAESHVIPLPHTFEQYLQALPGSRRYRLRKSLRDMQAWLGRPLELRRVSSAEELPSALEQLAQLHSDRWQSAGRTGAFASRPFRRFHEIVMPELLAQGALDMLFLDGPNGPIAGLYNIRWDGRIHFYQCGRDTGLPHGLRPGLVIHALAIADAIASGAREYDFLAGSARYKQELALDKRELLDFRIVHPTCASREQVRLALRSSAQAVRRFVR